MICNRVFKSRNIAENLTVVFASMLIGSVVFLDPRFYSVSSLDSKEYWLFYLGAGMQAFYWVISFLIYSWVREKLGCTLMIIGFFYFSGFTSSIQPKVFPLSEGIFGGWFWVLIIVIGFKLIESFGKEGTKNEEMTEDETSSDELISLNLDK